MARHLAKPDFCEVCHLPFCLYPASPNDRTICCDCEDKLKLERRISFPCECCGRTHRWQFSCRHCLEYVCEGCVYREHDLDVEYSDPEDWDDDL